MRGRSCRRWICWACRQSWTRYRLGCSVSTRASAVSIALLSGLSVAVVDQDESGRQGDRRIEAEHAEPGPGAEGSRLVMHGEDCGPGLHRKIGTDYVLPGARQERHDELRDEQHAEECRDRAGAEADDRAEAEAEQAEHRQVEAASGDRPEHARIAERGPHAVAGEECLKDEVGG